MQVLTFAQLVAQSVALGHVDGPVAGMGQTDQLMAALTAQEQRMAGLQPALEDDFQGAAVWQGAATGWVVQDGAATPITVHVGYSEHGAYVLHQGQVFHAQGMVGTATLDPVLWGLLQASRWPGPALAA